MRTYHKMATKLTDEQLYGNDPVRLEDLWQTMLELDKHEDEHDHQVADQVLVRLVEMFLNLAPDHARPMVCSILNDYHTIKKWYA